ncbi:MAG: transketolase C-terminal domain-containing protein, partial [Patescibacteria group bacterium]
MVVISPCDAIEARKATEASVTTDTPVYIRLAREKTPVMTTEETPFEIGKAQIFWQTDAPKVGIIATGALLYQALLAAKELKEAGTEVMVMNLSTIKPLDAEAIVSLAKKTGRIVTVEEHQKMGGMGSAVAECLAENYPVPVEFIGVDDQFGQSGTQAELLKHYGLDKEAIIKAVKKILKR